MRSTLLTSWWRRRRRRDERRRFRVRGRSWKRLRDSFGFTAILARQTALPRFRCISGCACEVPIDHSESRSIFLRFLPELALTMVLPWTKLKQVREATLSAAVGTMARAGFGREAGV
jgi:hypothetical protein